MRGAVPLCTLLSLASPLNGCPLTDQDERRAWVTGRAYVRAIADQDSVALAQLSVSGKAHNGLCAARLWPDALTGRNGGRVEVHRLHSAPDDSVWEFRAYGAKTHDQRSLPTGMVPQALRSRADSQPHAYDQRAAFDVAVLKRDPGHVSWFGIAHADTFNWEPFHTCIGW